MESKNENASIEQKIQTSHSLATLTSQLMKELSKELEDYITWLYTEGRKPNPKSVCVRCWCFITREQKEKHEPSQISDIVTHTIQILHARDLYKTCC